MGCTDFQGEEFSYIINAALSKIYNDCSIVSRGKLYAHGILPTSVRKEIYHPAGEILSYPLTGKAFSVRVCGGAPKIIVGTGDETSTHILSDGANVFKGFIENNMAIISFGGDFDYTIYDLCQYDELVSADKNQIPNGSDYTVYDMTDYLDDFRSFESMPTDVDGNPIDCAVAVGKEMKVKADYKGEIYFYYRRAPSRTVEYNSDIDIDIPREYEMLIVPLFMAIYCLNVDSSEVDNYMECYESMLKGLPLHKELAHTATIESPMTSAYLIKDGWA